MLNGIPERISTAQASLENARAQLETAKEQLDKPFPQAEELATKSARLAELNAQLDIDGRSPIEQIAEDEPEEVAKAIPSVLERLQELKKEIHNRESSPKKPGQQVI